jgi:hypothetical protein
VTDNLQELPLKRGPVPLAGTAVGSYMTSRVVTVQLDDRLGLIQELFDQVRFRHLLVPAFMPPPSPRWSLRCAGEMPGAAARSKARARSRIRTATTSPRIGCSWRN